MNAVLIGIERVSIVKVSAQIDCDQFSLHYNCMSVCVKMNAFYCGLDKTNVRQMLPSTKRRTDKQI